MRKTGLLIMFVLGSLLSHGQALSPYVIASGGDYLSNGSLSVSFTLGEVAVTTLQGNSLILTQGFQQPFELDVGTAVNELPVNWGVEAYPNPVTRMLRIRFSLPQEEDFILQITDLSGRKILVRTLNRVVPGQVEAVDLTGCSPGMYLVTLVNKRMDVKRMVKIEKRE